MNSNDIQYIKKLTDAFYEGETSLEEERILHKYFSEEPVPAELQNDRKIFLELYSVNEGDISPSFGDKLNSLIDGLEAQEKKEKATNLPAEKKSKKIGWKTAISIAASVLIVLSVGIYTYRDHHNSVTPTDTYSNPEDAYAETQKALLLVSTKLNKGFERVENAQKNIEKTNRIIEKNIKL